MIPPGHEPRLQRMLSLRERAQQLLAAGRGYDDRIFRELVELAALMEAHADRIERAAQRSEQDRLSDLAKDLAKGVACLQSVVRETLELAIVRAEAGEGAIADQLVGFAADLDMRAQAYVGALPPRKTDELLYRVHQLRFRAEKNRHVAASIANASAKDTLITAAESCECMAAALDRKRLRRSLIRG